MPPPCSIISTKSDNWPGGRQGDISQPVYLVAYCGFLCKMKWKPPFLCAASRAGETRRPQAYKNPTLHEYPPILFQMTPKSAARLKRTNLKLEVMRSVAHVPVKQNRRARKLPGRSSVVRGGANHLLMICRVSLGCTPLHLIATVSRLRSIRLSVESFCCRIIAQRDKSLQIGYIYKLRNITRLGATGRLPRQHYLLDLSPAIIYVILSPRATDGRFVLAP